MSVTQPTAFTGYATSTNRHRIVFDGDERRFELWEVKFLGFMKIRGLDTVLDDIPDDPATDTVAVDAAKNAEVFAELVQVLDDRSLSLIIREARNNGRKAISILRNHYLPKGKPRVITLYTELTSLLKRQSESVTDYIIRAETAQAALSNAGEVISDSLLVAMALKGLPKDYQSFTVVVTQREKAMSFSEFKVALRNFEDTERVQSQSSSASSIMSTKIASTQDTKFKNKRWCKNCKSNTHDTDFCRRSQTKNKNARWCEICKSNTHDTKFCRKLTKVHQMLSNPLEDKGSDSNPNNFFLKLDNSPDNNYTNTLLVDSGATIHVVNDESKFISFQNSFNPSDHTIELADGSRSTNIAKGMGDAEVSLTDTSGRQHNVVLKDALFIPSFSMSIFSVQAATHNGATVQFNQNSSEVSLQSTKFKIHKEGKLYFLKPSIHSKSQSRTLYEWHVVLGHWNKSDILKLEQNVEGMIISDKSDFNCEICALAKMTDLKSRKPDNSAKSNFDIVHTDLAGPVEEEDINGMRYAMICIDSFSKLSSPYFLKNKSDAHKAFKQYLADIAPYGQVRKVRSDVGGEFISKDFTSLLTDNKIRQEKTAPYSPHQNGKAERTWRSLFEMARCLLLQSGLPKSLWTYAVMAAAYIQNRCFHKNIGCTPFEKITGKKPNIANMEAFGSPCYALVQNPKKLDNRSEKGIFIGFDKGSPAYLVYFPETQVVRKVRCVKFLKDTQLSQGGNGYVVLPCEPSSSAEPKEPHMCEPSPNENSKETQNSQNAPDTANIDIQKSDDNSKTTGTRNRARPKYLDDYVTGDHADSLMNTTIHYCYNVNAIDVPQSYSEAMSSSDSSEWNLAMKTEMMALEENETFETVTLPKGKEVIGSRWVYAVKTDKDGNDHFKARFVAKGYSQVAGVDYEETFSPTANMNSIRIISQLAIQNNLDIHQMDVKAAYLNAPIDCEVYVKPPDGFNFKDENGNKLVLKLKKSLYGLKQSGRNWNNTLDSFLKEQGFKQSVNDPCFYTKDGNIFLVHWVDDIIVAAEPCSLKSVKETLKGRFKMKDLGQLSYFLGIEFLFENNKLLMSQSRYISKVLHRFKMNDCKPRPTPCELNPSHKVDDKDDPLNEADLKRYRQIVGSLIYIMIATRPDLSYAVTKLSQYMSCATQSHMTMAKHVLRYLKGTINDKMTFTKSEEPLEIIGFSDSDWANSIEDRKSITGYSFKMSQNGPLISWKSKKQPTVALSTCEAEYMALCSATQEGIYLMSFLNEVIDLNQTLFVLSCDNQGANALAKNPINRKRSKHIDIRFHFIREEISEGRLNVQYIPSEDNIADVFTKPMSAIKLKKFKPMIMG